MNEKMGGPAAILPACRQAGVVFAMQKHLTMTSLIANKDS